MTARAPPRFLICRTSSSSSGEASSPKHLIKWSTLPRHRRRQSQFTGGLGYSLLFHRSERFVRGGHCAADVQRERELKLPATRREACDELLELVVPGATLEDFGDEPFLRVRIARVCALLYIVFGAAQSILQTILDGNPVRAGVGGAVNIP